MQTFAPWLLAAASLVLAVAGVWRAQSQVAVLERRLADSERAGVSVPREPLRAPAAAATPSGEANVPLALLQTARSVSGVKLLVPASAARFMIWVEDLPAVVKGPVTLELVSPESGLVSRVGGLQRNQYGAIVAAFPAKGLTTGSYTLRVLSEASAAPVLSYELAITRSGS